ncbi:MAG: hypothetical protein ABIY70_06840 [Capsulimonas sp.]|uniref:DUF7336 domain-containing protein n=1 Tax=Capsulimonas sp. TaxID=2494211 RepID=UPI003264DC6A
MEVFVLIHIHTFEDGVQDFKMIGVYSSRDQAALAIERMLTQPGFCDTPEGFVITVYPVDADTHGWDQGRVSK